MKDLMFSNAKNRGARGWIKTAGQGAKAVGKTISSFISTPSRIESSKPYFLKRSAFGLSPRCKALEICSIPLY